jgi:hypothetical protein
MANLVQNYPVYQLPFLYINGFNISYVSVTTLSISAGQCRDSNDIMDIVIGNPPIDGNTTPAPVIVNSAVTGVNGLDVQPLTPGVYAVYAIGDSRYYNIPGFILTYSSNATPLMPKGYDSYRLVGYVMADGESQFFPQFTAGNTSTRIVNYSPLQNILTGGNSTSAASVSLLHIVPPISNIAVIINSDFAAATAGDQLVLTNSLSINSPSESTITITAPVVAATAHVTSQSTLVASTVNGTPTIDYFVTSASDSVTLNVSGYWYTV